MPRSNKFLPHHGNVHSVGYPLVRVEATIQTVFDGPVNHHGANHQQFIIKVNEQVFARGADLNLVGQNIFVAIRFGDDEGLDNAIPGLEAEKSITLQGEYVDDAEAYRTPDNPIPLPVLHFTHHPFGFVYYDNEYYS